MFITCQPESCLRHCIEGVTDDDDCSQCRLDRLTFLVCGLHAWQNALQVLHLDVDTSTLPALALPCFNTFVYFTILVSQSLMIQLSSWYPLLSSTTAEVLDQTFCWCCLLCGVDRWCHLWLTYSGARCRSFSRVESIFNPPTLARSRISHLTLSFIAHWGTCPGLAPCLALDSI